MNSKLSGKITLVTDGTGCVGAGIVRSLLHENATVIVPAKSAHGIRQLKEYVADVAKGKLITLLTDYPDYDKAFDIAENVIEEYGQIDLAVAAFDAPAASPCITELAITDWQKMTDENITACFVSARIVLSFMKEFKHGMYISISNTDDFENKSSLALANISALIQTEMAKLFFEEVKKHGLKYHHLFINNAVTRDKHTRLVHKDGWITPEAVGNYIVQLYLGETGTAENLFQWLLGKPIKEDAKIKQITK